MTAKDFYLEAMRRNDGGDHEGFLALQADDAEWIVPGATLSGKEEIRGWLEPFWQAFSSFRHDHTRIIEAGDTVVAEGTWTGTHDGPLATPEGEVPPTGREVSFGFIVIVDGDLDAGVARKVHVSFDQLEFLGQLGLIPAPAAA
jgi:predicted ester cyclase